MTTDEWRDRHENDPRTTLDLISAALCEPDEDLQWDAICVLHFRGNAEVLGAAKFLCRSSCEQERGLGADILGQLGVPDRTFPEESVAELLRMLQLETSPCVLEAIAFALGHYQHDPRAVHELVRFAHHREADVRYAVVHGLMGKVAPLAIATLIGLTEDPEAKVRDWATFALGSQIDLDTSEIRDALAARLNDPDEVTRAEAMAGLSRRGIKC
jgi:HEAT repeat protein